MSMEISPQHHSIVLGKQSSNLKMIMQRTGTQIMFPDAGDPNIPSLKKSNVTITGGIHNVYLARQQLVVGHVVRVIRFSYRQSVNRLSVRLYFFPYTDLSLLLNALSASLPLPYMQNTHISYR